MYCAMSLCESLSVETGYTVKEGAESEAPGYGVSRHRHLGARSTLSTAGGCSVNCGSRV